MKKQTRTDASFDLQIIRSSRKTISLQIKDGRLLVRAPLRARQAEIDALLDKHRAWIEKQLRAAQQRSAAAAQMEPLTDDVIRALTERAKALIPERVCHYAPLVGVSYGRITVRCQRTRWGSCSARGNLSFNCLLLLAPSEVLDSVVVHELCHRKEMNHSPRFYAEVLRVFPEYRKWNRWLKENGGMLMQRLRQAAESHETNTKGCGL